MTNNNKLYTYLAASLALLLPVPGRISYGLIILIHFNMLVLFTTLLTHAIRHMYVEKFRPAIIALEIIAMTIFFKQLLSILCPVASLTLSLAIYFPAVSSVILTILVTGHFEHLKEDLSEKLKTSLLISGFSFILFAVRDIFGYGTITIPYWQDIIVISLPSIFKSISVGAFLATIPGCIILIAILVAVFKSKETASQKTEQGE